MDGREKARGRGDASSWPFRRVEGNPQASGRMSVGGYSVACAAPRSTGTGGKGELYTCLVQVSFFPVYFSWDDRIRQPCSSRLPGPRFNCHHVRVKRQAKKQKMYEGTLTGGGNMLWGLLSRSAPPPRTHVRASISVGFGRGGGGRLWRRACGSPGPTKMADTYGVEGQRRTCSLDELGLAIRVRPLQGPGSSSFRWTAFLCLVVSGVECCKEGSLLSRAILPGLLSTWALTLLSTRPGCESHSRSSMQWVELSPSLPSDREACTC
ncbi:hypothetical protein LZ30DRAFT_108342 [Colletotrichum cereale]|nr:hypothetical protein LZ30DRAFT_108342 [Colletotrichum cereale]